VTSLLVLRVLDVPLPVPVSRKDDVHGLERRSLGLRQEARDEDGHDDHPCGVEEEDSVLEVAEQGEEDLGLQEGEDEGDRQRDGLRHGPDVKRVDLAPHHPLERAPRHAQAEGVEAHDRHHGLRVLARHGRRAEVAGQDPRHGHLAEQHADPAGHEQEPAAVPVHHERGHDDGEESDRVDDDGAQQRLAAAEPDRAEQHGWEDEDEDEAREVEEGRDGHHDHRVGPVPSAAQPLQRAVLVPPRRRSP
jgi:hypothetical protein